MKNRYCNSIANLCLLASGYIALGVFPRLREYRIEKGCDAYVNGDYKTALKYCIPAAKRGHVKSMYIVGECYVNGDGVSQSWIEAVKWYRKSAEQGNALAQFNLGRCYAHGNGVRQSWTEAVKWYRKSAAQGNENAKEELKRLGY